MAVSQKKTICLTVLLSLPALYDERVRAMADAMVGECVGVVGDFNAVVDGIFVIGGAGDNGNRKRCDSHEEEGNHSGEAAKAAAKAVAKAAAKAQRRQQMRKGGSKGAKAAAKAAAEVAAKASARDMMARAKTRHHGGRCGGKALLKEFLPSLRRRPPGHLTYSLNEVPHSTQTSQKPNCPWWNYL